MLRNSRKGIKQVVVAAFAVWLLTDPGRMDTVNAAALPPLCDGYCDPGAECYWVCQIPAGETYQFITCADFEGGASGGMCDPNTCNRCRPGSPCNMECSIDSEQADCYEFGMCETCGDGVCVPGVETRTSCPADCGYCGDGVCQGAFERTTNSWCTADCGPNGAGANECDTKTNAGCEGGMYCTSYEECVSPENSCSGGPYYVGSCHSDSDCCDDRKCVVFCDPTLPLEEQEYHWMCGFDPTAPAWEYREKEGVCLPPELAPKRR
jgi:hypothetical protein